MGFACFRVWGAGFYGLGFRRDLGFEGITISECAGSQVRDIRGVRYQS